MAHLEKAFELDPIPQGQTNSLRRISAIIFGCFLIEDYQRCISFSEQLENFDFRTWFLLAKIFSLKSSKDLQFWLKKSDFKISGLDLNMEIDRFHLNDDKLKGSLIKFAKELSSLDQ